MAGIGIPENPYLPSLSFKDFLTVREGPIIWKRIADFLIEKYRRLSELKDGVGQKEHAQFYNRLLKHSNNDKRSVLVFGGCWNFSGIEFSKSLISHCNLSVYSLSLAHPLTNLPNAKEMNPNLTGSLSEVHTSERFLFTTPVCLGEEGFDGDMHFGCAHNTHVLILSKTKHPHEKDSIPDMFHNLTHTNLLTYLAPEGKDTGSEVGEENFVLSSF